jgi:hypothetical protein
VGTGPLLKDGRWDSWLEHHFCEVRYSGPSQANEARERTTEVPSRRNASFSSGRNARGLADAFPATVVAYKLGDRPTGQSSQRGANT